MPEGDTIFRIARTLHAALSGRLVTRFESVFPHVTRVHEDAPVTGRTVEEVRAAGKHLLIVFSGGLVLRSHLRMSGRWHLYRADEAWRRPASSMRVLVGTAEYVAVAFDVQDAGFQPARTLHRDGPVAALGPDLLAADFDEDQAVFRLRAFADEPIAVALLDQRRLAGIGNVYKSETLFLCRISPFARVSALDDERLRALARTARRLMRVNVTRAGDDGIVTSRGLRCTTRRSDPAARLWVYGRRGQPCRACGTPVEARKLGLAARTTYWCPRCQPLPGTT